MFFIATARPCAYLQNEREDKGTAGRRPAIDLRSVILSC